MNKASFAGTKKTKTLANEFNEFRKDIYLFASPPSLFELCRDKQKSKHRVSLKNYKTPNFFIVITQWLNFRLPCDALAEYAG
jgi:hypothetical protein